MHKNETEVCCLIAEHKHSKCDLPLSIRTIERWLGPVGAILIASTFQYYPAYIYLVVTILIIVWLGAKCLSVRLSQPPYIDFHPSSDSNCIDHLNHFICFGSPAELAPLSNLEANHFEPIVFRLRSRLYMHSLSDEVPIRLLSLWCGFLVLLFGLWYFGMPPLYLVAIAILMHEVLPSLIDSLRKRYVRISPQRMEIMHFSPWKSQPLFYLALDLTDTKITCRFDKQKLVLEVINQQYASTCIDLREVDTPHAFAKCLFQAAKSYKMAPILPLDSFIG